VSPEASTFTNTLSTYGQIKWTNAISNKLLLEARGSRIPIDWNGAPPPGAVITMLVLKGGEIFTGDVRFFVGDSGSPRSF
jgi:hypothetical protein